MPFDQGAPAPRSLSSWIEHLRRRKLAAKKGRSVAKRRRAITEQRIRIAEDLLIDIIDGADLIGEGVIDNRSWYSASGVYLLVGLTWPSFDRLCAIGAETEDLEDSHDAEPDTEGQPSLMPATGDDRPGFDGTDRELDACDLGKPRGYPAAADRAIVDAARARHRLR